MLQRRAFKQPAKPDRAPMAWPGKQDFAPASRADGAGEACPKPVEHRNPALLAMARGKRCLLQVPGVCNCDPRTTVACHSNLGIHGKAKSRKADDQYSVQGCSACHTWLDQGPAPKAEKTATFMRAHLDQVLAWRMVVGDMSYTPRERKAAHWALCLLEASPTRETP
ncbi:MAG: nuclease domain-containing protein [Pseudomonadota bacterium]